MSIFGTVGVASGKFRFKGDFHAISHQLPIRNVREGRLMGITSPRTITHVHMYGGEAIFFESLSKKKIYATRCDNPDCMALGTVYLPFRIHCPDCLVRNTVVDITKICHDTAIIHTYMVCERSGAFNTLDKPINFINIAFEGIATILMSYLSAGTPQIGERVVPIFKTIEPTYTITDLSWVRLDTADDLLPQGFSY